MDAQDVLAGVLAALYDAALNDVLWPSTSALIDEAVGIKGNALLITEGLEADVRILFAAAYYRGQRRPDLERDYLENYHPWDERIPRLQRLPDSKLAHVTQLYTEQELKTSRSYNEFSRRSGGQNSLNVRLAGPDDSHITWVILDPVKAGVWQSANTRMVELLLPHIRHFVHVRQALASAQALGSSLNGLLDNTRIGVIHLERRGRIIEANVPAQRLLRRPDGLYGRDGFLGAWLPADNANLQRLLARALPPLGSQSQAAAGSMTIRRSPNLPKLVLHINPVGDRWLDFGARRVAALVLVVDAGSQPRLDAELVAEVLGLTPAESQVAVMLSEGRTVRDIAMATGRREGTVYILLKRAYKKLGISRQVDLVRLVRPLADVSALRP